MDINNDKNIFKIITKNNGEIIFEELKLWRINLINSFIDKKDKNKILQIELITEILKFSIYKINDKIICCDTFKENKNIFDLFQLNLEENELHAFAELFLNNHNFLLGEDKEIIITNLDEMKEKEDVDPKYLKLRSINNKIDQLYNAWIMYYDDFKLSYKEFDNKYFPNPVKQVKNFSIDHDSLLYGSKKKFDEVLKEKNQSDKNEVNINNKKCNICDKNISDNYFCYLIESKEKEQIYICSLNCLNKFREKLDSDIDNYDIYQIRRCSAYFKCLETGNLRKMCERKELLTKRSRDLSTLSLTNFCEPGQAGLILTTYQIHDYLIKFGKETNNQSKVTFYMTILVIILTIFNIIPPFLNLFDKKSEIQLNEIKEIKNKIVDLNNIVSKDTSNDKIISKLEIINQSLEKIEKNLKNINIKNNINRTKDNSK